MNGWTDSPAMTGVVRRDVLSTMYESPCSSASTCASTSDVSTTSHQTTCASIDDFRLAILARKLTSAHARHYVLPRLDRFFAQTNRNNALLNSFLAVENRQMPLKAYFKEVQTEVTVEMRSVVVEWMLDVCKETGCFCEVFPLAVLYLDRFLSVEAVHKMQLQALATSCLLVASKMKEPFPISGVRLVDLTDNSVSTSELLSWELLLLNRLEWNLTAVTAFDFLEQYLNRLSLSPEVVEQLRPLLNQLVALSAMDFDLAVLKPSIIAARCLQDALLTLDAERRLLEDDELETTDRGVLMVLNGDTGSTGGKPLSGSNWTDSQLKLVID